MEIKNLAQHLSTLPAELSAALSQLKSAAQAGGYRLYIVGGAVRDLLLGLPARDIDVVVLGDAISLTKALPRGTGKLTIYPVFGTATISFGSLRLDLSSARTESYPRPGALPTVRHSTLEDDISRRDFTINALAISLNEDDYGHLIDCCGGQKDLTAKLIRAMHPKSFSDDPTRIWRAVRYEQRLSFGIEPDTLGWLKKDVTGLKNISGERLWYELECVLREDEPEKTLLRLGALGVLAQMRPPIQADNWLADKFRGARKRGCHLVPTYLALLIYRLQSDEAEIFARYLHLGSRLRRILQDTQAVKAKLPGLSRPNLKPSTIYHRLHGHATEAVEATLVASTSTHAQRNIALYQDKLRMMKTSLKGNDLANLGVQPGPRVGEIMRELFKARLDGLVDNRTDELALAKSLIAA